MQELTLIQLSPQSAERGSITQAKALHYLNDTDAHQHTKQRKRTRHVVRKKRSSLNRPGRNDAAANSSPGTFYPAAGCFPLILSPNVTTR